MTEQNTEVTAGDGREASSVCALVMPWLYSPASTAEIAALRRICWGNSEAQAALDGIDRKHRAMREVARNAVHAHCFGTEFHLLQAQDALEA